MLEKWKDINGYRGMYQVSNKGRVKSLERRVECGKGYRDLHSKILKPNNSDGYLFVVLHKGNKRKQYYIHRLVALHFIDNTKNKPTINHIDGDKKNNKLVNLEWSSYSENTRHAYDTNLNTRNNPVRQLDLKGGLINEFSSTREAERETGILQSSISRVCTGGRGRKTAGGYRWEYVNVGDKI